MEDQIKVFSDAYGVIYRNMLAKVGNKIIR